LALHSEKGRGHGHGYIDALASYSRPRRRAAEGGSPFEPRAMTNLLRHLTTTLCWTPVALAAADVLGRPAPVADARMAPALAPGDLAFHDRLSCRLYRFRRGEVVVMK